MAALVQCGARPCDALEWRHLRLELMPPRSSASRLTVVLDAMLNRDPKLRLHFWLAASSHLLAIPLRQLTLVVHHRCAKVCEFLLIQLHFSVLVLHRLSQVQDLFVRAEDVVLVFERRDLDILSRFWYLIL